MESTTQTSTQPVTAPPPGDGGTEITTAENAPVEIAELSESDFKKLAKLKIDGKETKVSVSELLKRAQKGAAADKRFQEASRLQNEIDRRENLARTNPKEYLKMLGHDLDAMADQAIQEQIKRAQMNDQERKEYELQQKYEGERQKRETYEKQMKDRDEAHFNSQVEQQIDQEYSQAIKELNYPKNSYLIQRAAVEQIRALNRGENLSAKDALVKIKEEFIDSSRAFMKDAGLKDAKAIREFLGDDIVKLILDSEVKRVTAGGAPTSNSVARSGNSVPPDKKENKKPLSEREWREWQASLLKK